MAEEKEYRLIDVNQPFSGKPKEFTKRKNSPTIIKKAESDWIRDTSYQSKPKDKYLRRGIRF